MDKLIVKDVWELELHLYKHAVDHGVKPVTAVGIGSWPKNESDPTYWCFYQPRTVLFENPPSRAYFWQMVASTPWMQGIDTEYRAIIDRGDWPMIDFSIKSAHVYLKDDQGREVGHISVSRSAVVQNHPYSTYPIFGADIAKACGVGRKMGHTTPASDAVQAAANKLKERLSLLDHAPTEDDAQAVILAYLKEIGINPKRKIRAAL